MDSIVIAAHGSRDRTCTEAAETHAARLSEILGTKVRHAYKGHDEPTIPSVLSEIAAEEPDRIVVLPLFFAPGMFPERIIPSKFGLPQGTLSGTIPLGGRDVPIVIAGVFGTHPGMRRVMEKVLAESGADPADTSVLLIGHGSPDGFNRSTLDLNAGYVADAGYRVHRCFNEFERPDIAEGLAEAEADGCGTILAIPMFVSSSHHSEVEIPEGLGLAPGTREGPAEVCGRTVHIVYLREIGLDPGIADILLETYREAARRHRTDGGR
ncbi:MAG: CbiX/SirB N-terminal domain-containing protein [Thermoplasmata archaeon]|nr:CbiX/SirB N-terminal domain-containing protein [Thermoplasmata archaeon]